MARELAKRNIKGVCNFRKTAFFRVGVDFINYKDANRVVEEQLLSSYNSFIPTHLVQTMGTAFIDKEISVDEILQNIESSVKILNIWRINKRAMVEDSIQYVPTNWVGITFEGINTPNNIIQG